MSLKHPKTAVVTLHPYLPSEEEQLNGAREWGMPEEDITGSGVTHVWRDDVRKVRTTNWPSKLPQRDVLMRVYTETTVPEDEVFFANPLCVGFSKGHALSVAETIHGAGALFYVHDMQREFRPGDDLDPLWKEHARQLKNAQMRQHRKVKAK